MNKEKQDFSLNPIIRKIEKMLWEEDCGQGKIVLKEIKIRKHFEGYFIDYSADITR